MNERKLLAETNHHLEINFKIFLIEKKIKLGF